MQLHHITRMQDLGSTIFYYVLLTGQGFHGFCHPFLPITVGSVGLIGSTRFYPPEVQPAVSPASYPHHHTHHPRLLGSKTRRQVEALLPQNSETKWASNLFENGILGIPWNHAAPLLKNFDFFDLEVVVSPLQCSQRWQLLCWRILEAERPMHMLHVQHKHSAVTPWPPKRNVLSPVGNPNLRRTKTKGSALFVPHVGKPRWGAASLVGTWQNRSYGLVWQDVSGWGRKDTYLVS